MTTPKQKDQSGTVSITLKRSPIGRSSKQRVFLHGLGLRRLHQTVERPKNPQVLGLIDKVKHLVEVIKT